MNIFFRKRKGAYGLSTLARLGEITFIVGIATAMIGTIWAVYLDSFFHNAALISFFSAFLTIVAFVSYFLLIPFIESHSKSRICLVSLLLMAITYVLFAINKNLILFTLIAIAYIIISAARITSYGIIVKDKSNRKLLSRNEGVIYTFLNIAWVIGPFIAGWLSDKYNISLIFVLAAILIFIALIIFRTSRLNDANIKKKVDTNFWKNFLTFFKNKDRFIAYLLGGGVNCWLILIYIYMPLYILNQGIPILWVGYFLFAVAIPTTLTEYYFSKLAGKIGFKKIFQIGFFILAALALTSFFVPNPYIVMGLIVTASLGLAMIEPTTEAYFLDLIKTKDEENRFYGPYNTAIDTNDLATFILVGILLAFLPFKSIFILFSAMMLVYFSLSFKTKNINESRKK